jgi:hypothetical protein
VAAAFNGVSCRQPSKRFAKPTIPITFVDVSYFAQTPGDKGEKLTIGKTHIGRNSLRGCLMTLIFWYLGFMILGDFLAYFIGRFVEYEWGSYASLVVFLALYFVSLWIAWLLSVWVTEPKKKAA